jgi:hypothetical protein
MLFEYSEEQIQNILTSYKNKREKEKERYDKIKGTEEFKIANRQRAKNYYQTNKELKKEKYENNKTMIRAKNSYYYYKRKNDIEKFKEKFPDRYNTLLISGYLSE